MSRFIYIGKEGFRVECEEHFAHILEEKLGRDAADLFKTYLKDAEIKSYDKGYYDGYEMGHSDAH